MLATGDKLAAADQLNPGKSEVLQREGGLA